MKWGVVRFPGSLDDNDALHALREVLGQDAAMLWHKDETLAGAECVVLPGGFSYGDYLRCGAIARFSPIMKSIAKFAADGGLVMGICNGFQILCEAHLLPGALTRNAALSFICDRVTVRVENAATPFTRAARPGEILRIPIKHGEGCYIAPDNELRQMEERGQVLLRYVDAAGRGSEAANPNGSMRSIAGLANDRFNVFGLMPHPEHAVEPMLGGDDGLKIFRSIIESAR
jgi:phosphoribosylformylglycinamidine synthase